MKRLVFYILILSFSLCGVAQQAKVADVKVQGNKKLRTSAILKITKLKAGAVLDSLKLNEDIKWLKRLPSVAHAYYQVFPAQQANEYNVFYNIEENFTIIPSANIYTTNDDEFAYRLGLQEFNALGRNITVGGFYQRDIFDSYAINVKAPFLFSRKLGVAINYQNLTTLEPVFFDGTTADYKYNNESFEVLGLYQFNFNHRIETGLSFFTEDYEFRQGATSPNVPQALRVDKLLYKLIYEYNNLNYYYQYVEGFRSILNFQYVNALEGNQLPDFVIAWNDFIYYKRFGTKGNWASRLRLGLATNDDTPFAPFAVDNNLNVRGVGNLIDRGTGAIILNTEYRQSLYDKEEGWFSLQGNAFIDAGSWRNPGGEFGDFAKSQNIRVYPGVGLRFIHKKIFNAIFRIDYGFGITENASNGFVFGIGQYF